MSKRTYIGLGIFAGLGVIGYALYQYVKKQKDLLLQYDWSIMGINFDTISQNLLSGTLTFRFINKSDIEITAEQFYFDFYFNGTYVGWLQDAESFTIPARGYNDIEFRVNMNPQMVIGNILDIIAYATKKKDAIIGLDGKATLRSGFIKTTVKINCDCSTKNLSCNC
jgi:hypothetical protein